MIKSRKFIIHREAEKGGIMAKQCTIIHHIISSADNVWSSYTNKNTNNYTNKNTNNYTNKYTRNNRRITEQITRYKEQVQQIVPVTCISALFYCKVP